MRRHIARQLSQLANVYAMSGPALRGTQGGSAGPARSYCASSSAMARKAVDVRNAPPAAAQNGHGGGPAAPGAQCRALQLPRTWSASREWPDLERRGWTTFLQQMDAQKIAFGTLDTHRGAPQVRRAERETWTRDWKALVEARNAAHGRSIAWSFWTASGAVTAMNCNMPVGLVGGAVGLGLLGRGIARAPLAGLDSGYDAEMRAQKQAIDQAITCYQQGDLAHCRWLVARAGDVADSPDTDGPLGSGTGRG